VLEVDNRRALSTEHYAWTWALATLLDGHPRFQKRFRALKQHVAEPEFNARFRKAFAEDWSELLAEWDAFAAQLDYGYDVPRMSMMHRPAEPIESTSKRVSIEADRGWQSTGWLLRAGQTYRVTASGRFQIADDGQSWPCEAGGVTIEYHDGMPLGALLGALRATDGDHSTFAHPQIIGRDSMLRPDRDAVLYVRVNDSSSQLSDNVGELTVKISPQINTDKRR